MKRSKKKRNYIGDVFRSHHPFLIVAQGTFVEFSIAIGYFLLGDQMQRNPELASKPVPPFTARVSYEDLAGGKYQSEFTIDVRELEGLGANKSPEMRAVSALEKIAKSMQ